MTSMMTDTAKVLTLKSTLKPSDIRKNKKPLMERKRRERINTCLQELKKLVVDSSQKENGRCAKLEKADILEMTVKHLRGMQRKRDITKQAAHTETTFLAGFGECAQEVARYITTIADLDSDVKNRVIRHLSTSIQNLPPRTRDTPTLQVIPSASQVNMLPGTCNINNNINMQQQVVSVPAKLQPTTTQPTMTTTPVMNTNNGQTFVVATAAPLVTNAPIGNNLAINSAQIGRIAIVLPNGQTTGQIIPVYTNFTPVSPVGNSTGTCRPPVTNNENSGLSNNVKDHGVSSPCSDTNVTNNPTNQSTVTNNQSVNSIMWRPW